MSTQKLRFGVLDGWRGVCAIFVAVAHADFLGHYYFWPIVRNAHMFVDFFFVLSGFVLAHAYADRIGAGRDWGVFAMRRIGRLWPLHVALLAVFIAIEIALLLAQRSGLVLSFRPAFTDTSPASAVVSNVLLIQALGLHEFPTFNRPSWSISTELYGNFLLGLMWLFLPKHWRTWAAVLLAVASAAVVASFSSAYMRSVVGVAFFRCTYGLAAGLIAYDLFKRTAAVRLGRPSVVEWMTVLAVGLYVSMADETGWTMLAPLVFAAAIVVFAREAGAVSRFFSATALRRVGDWSYSIYMVHFLVLTAVAIGVRLVETALGAKLLEPVDVGGATIKLVAIGGKTAMDLAVLAYLGIVLVVASMTYRWIEVPARSAFNRWSHRIALSGAEPAPTGADAMGKRKG